MIDLMHFSAFYARYCHATSLSKGSPSRVYIQLPWSPTLRFFCLARVSLCIHCAVENVIPACAGRNLPVPFSQRSARSTRAVYPRSEAGPSLKAGVTSFLLMSVIGVFHYEKISLKEGVQVLGADAGFNYHRCREKRQSGDCQ
jgi:hypothetical protein